MQSANKALWKDIMVFRSKDVPWRDERGIWWTTCIPSSLSGENWSWTIHTMDRIKRWETKMMMRLFRFKRRTDEPWVEFHTRCCKTVRKIWIQIGLPFLHDKIAESMWRAMGWYVIGETARTYWDRCTRKNIGTNQKALRRWSRPISKIDDCVKHFFREHNQEADHWANL